MRFVCTNMSINRHTCFCKVVLCIQTLNLGLVIRETKKFSQNQRLLIQKPKSVLRARVDHHHWIYYSIYFSNSSHLPPVSSLLNSSWQLLGTMTGWFQGRTGKTQDEPEAPGKERKCFRGKKRRRKKAWRGTWTSKGH